MAWPSSLIRVSTTLVSGFWQKGQCIRQHLNAKGRKTHVYRAYELINLNKLLEFSKQLFPSYKLSKPRRRRPESKIAASILTWNQNPIAHAQIG